MATLNATIISEEQQWKMWFVVGKTWFDKIIVDTLHYINLDYGNDGGRRIGLRDGESFRQFNVKVRFKRH